MHNTSLSWPVPESEHISPQREGIPFLIRNEGCRSCRYPINTNIWGKNFRAHVQVQSQHERVYHRRWWWYRGKVWLPLTNEEMLLTRWTRKIVKCCSKSPLCIIIILLQNKPQIIYSSLCGNPAIHLTSTF